MQIPPLDWKVALKKHTASRLHVPQVFLWGKEPGSLSLAALP